MINKQNSAVYKISKLLSKELQQLTISGKNFIRDSKGLGDDIKDEKLMNTKS